MFCGACPASSNSSSPMDGPWFRSDSAQIIWMNSSPTSMIMCVSESQDAKSNLEGKVENGSR